MKLRFPYRTASELYLFQTNRKVTLYHMLVPMSGAGVVGFMAGILQGRLSKLYLWPACAAAFLTVSVAAFWLFRALLPLLKKGVDRGLVDEPDMERWRKQIGSYAGWKEDGD